MTGALKSGHTPPAVEVPLTHCDETWAVLPERLRGRGDWLLERGRIKDAELMFDAASEIDQLRAAIAATRSAT